MIYDELARTRSLQGKRTAENATCLCTSGRRAAAIVVVRVGLAGLVWARRGASDFSSFSGPGVLLNVRGLVLRFLRARRAMVVVLGLATGPLWLVEETEIGRKREGIDWCE